MRFLKENQDRTYYLSDYLKWTFARNFSNYKPTIVDIDTVIKDSKLLDDNSVLNRRSHIWGDSYDKYKLNLDKLKLMSNDPIRLEIINGKYRVLDGSHRLIALKNAGYEKAEVLIKELK